jgi:hypothetical protein
VRRDEKIEEGRKIKWCIELVLALPIPGWMPGPANQHGRIDPFDKPATPASGHPHEVMLILFSSLFKYRPFETGFVRIKINRNISTIRRNIIFVDYLCKSPVGPSV